MESVSRDFLNSAIDEDNAEVYGINDLLEELQALSKAKLTFRSSQLRSFHDEVGRPVAITMAVVSSVLAVPLAAICGPVSALAAVTVATLSSTVAAINPSRG